MNSPNPDDPKSNDDETAVQPTAHVRADWDDAELWHDSELTVEDHEWLDVELTEDDIE